MKSCLFSGMFKEESIFTAIEEAAKIGYDGVEVMVGFGADHLAVDSPPDKVRDIAQAARDNGVALPLIYTTLGGNILSGSEAANSQLDQLEKFLDMADVMSCGMIKVTAGRLKNSDYKDDEALLVAEWLAAAAEHAARHNARICAEIHFGQYCETVWMARKMLNLVDMPNFGVIHDAGNLHITGEDYAEASVGLLAGSIFHVHIKDMVQAAEDDPEAHDYKAGRFKRALLGKGDVDHLPLFRALKNSGYDGYLSCEASGKHLGPVETAKHEYRELQRLLASL